MFDWIVERFKERTSWDGAVLIAVGVVGVLFLVLGSLSPYIAYAAAGVAIAWGVWTMWAKEQ